VHDISGVFSIGPFFGDDGEADAPPGGLRGVTAAGDGARVEGIHDALVYLSSGDVCLLVWFYCSTVLRACVNPVLPA